MLKISFAGCLGLSPVIYALSALPAGTAVARKNACSNLDLNLYVYLVVLQKFF